MQLDIPSEQWGALIGAAVMQSVTQDNRDKLVREAVQHLLTPEKDYQGNRRSPLQIAFDDALRVRAGKYIEERIDEYIGEQIRSVVEEALRKAFEEERRMALVSNISDAIVKAFRVDRY
jgi:SpoVK/Ycf46/Vps4 family AAA+-type ATPase